MTLKLWLGVVSRSGVVVYCGWRLSYRINRYCIDYATSSRYLISHVALFWRIVVEVVVPRINQSRLGHQHIPRLTVMIDVS